MEPWLCCPDSGSTDSRANRITGLRERRRAEGQERVRAAWLLRNFAAVYRRDAVDVWEYSDRIAEWHKDTEIHSHLNLMTEKRFGRKVETLRRRGKWVLRLKCFRYKDAKSQR